MYPGACTGIFYVHPRLPGCGQYTNFIQSTPLMKGYLLKEQDITIGEEVFIESTSSENSYAVMFEDDGESGYFYAAEKESDNTDLRILDMLHIYDVESIPDAEKKATLRILWSKDWLKCALVIDSYCHAVIDFNAQGAYNRNEFPEPNDFWTAHPRKLTDEMVAEFFS